MSITWRTPGAIAYSLAGGTSVSPAYPSGTAEADKLLLIIGQKPSTANGGSVTTPSGWNLVTSITGAGGYGTSLAADTGNTNLFVYERTVPSGGLSGSLTVTVGSNNVCWAIILRMTSTLGGWDSVAGATGSDTSAGSVSITFSSNPGVMVDDMIVGAMCIPTDISTPAQFSSEAFSQSGVTFGAVTEIGEPDSGNGNDIGGFLCYASVTLGTGIAAPAMTATAGGTTTNVRGPGVFIRVREGIPVERHTLYCTCSTEVSSGVLAAKSASPYCTAESSISPAVRVSKTGRFHSTCAAEASSVTRVAKKGITFAQAVAESTLQTVVSKTAGLLSTVSVAVSSLVYLLKTEISSAPVTELIAVVLSDIDFTVRSSSQTITELTVTAKADVLGLPASEVGNIEISGSVPSVVFIPANIHA